MALYSLQGVSLSYRGPSGPVPVLRDLDFTVNRGECCVIAGPSGSGKSTLLHLLAGMRVPEVGSIWFDGTDLVSLGRDAAATFRSHHIGMVFQAFHLMPHLTARENVMLPQWIAGTDSRRASRKAEHLLAHVGLASRTRHLPRELSGGEQQRVAIARALASDPDVVLADEPTGNLDGAATASVTRLLADLCSDGRTVVIATHDPTVATIADQRLTLDEPGVYTWECVMSHPPPI